MRIILRKKIEKLLLNQSISYYSTKVPTILGIETSCDDTGVAIVNSNREILAESKYNQWTVHKKLGHAKIKPNSVTPSFSGGVIPDLARKLHYENIMPAVSECIEKIDGKWANIDAIALTVKPGLEPCLWEGLKFTRLLLQRHTHLKFIPIHHMEAHALVSRLFDSELKFPFLTLLISGGHCLMVLVESHNRFLRLGESMDISPGNCLDKVARQLGLFEISKHDCSSGGALLEIYASRGDPQVYKSLTDSMLNFCRKNKNCHFSYGGVISAAFRLIEKETLTNSEPIKINDTIKNVLKEDVIANISAAVQASIILQLQDRLKRALIFLEYNKIKTEHVVISGGVASNKEIRSVLEKECKQFNLKISLPPISYCTDNGVMIAWNGVEKLAHNSGDIVLPEQLNKEFFEDFKPVAKSELGEDISNKLKFWNIKL